MNESALSIKLSVQISEGTIPLCAHAVVIGTLNFEGQGSVSRLPESLTVDGDLYLRGTSIKRLPSDLRVSGKIDLEGCKLLTVLSEHLNVGGNLDLEGCELLSGLPADLRVGGDIFLAGTNVLVIPPTAKIGGAVYGLSSRG